MPLYRVDRQLTGVTEDDIEAAAFRALTCLGRFPGLTWVRSYFEPEQQRFTCYYDTEQPEDIPRHAAAARIPCDAIARVTEYLPDNYR